MRLIMPKSAETKEQTPVRVEHRVISLKSSRADTAVVGVAGNTGYYGYQVTGEYLKSLDGAKGRVIFDQMRRSDSQVQATLRAIKLPIRRCRYSVQPGGKTPKDKEIADIITKGLFEEMSITWDDAIRHALLMMEFGFSPLEKVWERRGDTIMLKKLDPRLPSSIVSWKFDRVKKSLIGPEQMDLDGKLYVLPIEKMLVFTNEREGDNWEGTSILRSAYKAWYIKDQLEKINAIKHDRHGVGVPLASVPPDVKEGTEQWEAVVASLEALYAQEQSYLIQPEGYTYSILGADGKSGTEVLPSIKYYDECIARSMLAMFINLGTSATGSRALGSSFIDVFMDSLQAYADYIADVMNRFLVREWVGYNWGEDVDMPKLVAGRIQPLDVPGLQAAVSAKLITVDAELENVIRKQLNLPEREEADEEEKAATDEAPVDEAAAEEEPPVDERQEDVGLSERRLADEVLADEERLVDRAAMEQRLNSQQATLADRLRAMRDRQAEAIAMQLVGGKLIQNVAVPLKKDMYDEMVAAFKASRRAGTADVVSEVSRQRPDLNAKRALADPKKRVKARDMADLELERMNVDVAGQASKTLSTVARWNIDLKQSGLQGDQLRVALMSRYRDMSVADLDRMAAGAVNKGWGVGRQDGFEAVADEIDYCYYSTMMDSGVCSECASTQQAAGSQRHEPGDPDFATPNPMCLGGNLCRCMTIAVMRAESVETLEEAARGEAARAGAKFGGPGSGRYPKGSGEGKRSPGSKRGAQPVIGEGKIVESSAKWRAEDKVTGTATVEMADDFDPDTTPLEDVEVASLVAGVITERAKSGDLVDGLESEEDVEMAVTHVAEMGRGYVKVTFEITPSADAGARWQDAVDAGEQWDTMHQLGGPGSGRYPAGSGGEKSSALRQDSPEEAELFTNDNSFSDQQRNALLSYRGTQYHKINHDLRADVQSFESKVIDEAFDEAAYELTEDTALFRGASFDTETLDTLSPGSEFVDKGFLSTSYREDVAEEFTVGSKLYKKSGKEPVLVRIEAPAGTKFIKMSGDSNEAEILLKRGSRLRVKASNTPPGGKFRILICSLVGGA